MTCLDLGIAGANSARAESANRRGWRTLVCALSLAATLLSAVAAYGQQVYWTDHYSSVKKLGEGGAVEIVVQDSDATKGLAIDEATGKMYWASAEIERADLDGTNRELVIFNGISNALGMDIDPVNRKIYWADNQTNAVSRANLDGSNRELVIPEYSVFDVAVDPVGGKVYWNANGSSLKRANPDGSEVEILLNNLPTIGDIDIDPVERKIYWDHFVSGTHFIRRANLDGNWVVEPVRTGGNHTGTFAIGLDIVARKLYWGCVGVDTPEGTKCAMFRANLDAGQEEVVVITGAENWDVFFDIRIIPDPGDLCDLALSHVNETLNLNFQLATSAPATWNLWLSIQNSTIPLWSIPLPVIGSPYAAHIPIPNFPQLGKLGFLTTLTRPDVGIVCSEWATIDTGPGAATAMLLRQLQERLRGRTPR